MTVCTYWIESDEALADCGCPDGPEFIVESAITTAVDILYELSGRQYPGTCTKTVRPCKANQGCGCYSTSHLCTCSGVDLLELPHPAVSAVTGVLIDGAVFTDYTLYSPNWLARTDSVLWPCCQDLSKATTEAGTWSVTYTYGQEPPEGGKTAARVLTAELVKACTGDKSCRIPTGAVSLSRRGVTYDLSAQDGRTGLAEVDSWLDSVNRWKRKQRAQMVSPDDTRFIPT